MKKFLIFLTIFGVNLFASVDASVDYNKVTQGDMVTLRIEASGDDIKMPDIKQICGVNVISVARQKSIQMINGNVKKSIIQSYGFEPQKSCVIEPLEVEVDGKKEKTKPIKITVTKYTPSNLKDEFYLSLSSKKDTVYAGESFEVVLTFKQRKDANVVDSKFYPPKLDGFWIKEQSTPEKSIEGDYIVTRIRYKLSAQRPGTLTIGSSYIKIAQKQYMQDAWGFSMATIRWRSIYSNDIHINVSKPPVKIVGDFKVSLDVDKTAIHPNEAVTATLTIKGDGNLEDIEPFKPYIDGVSVFDEKPKIDYKTNIFTEKITFVTDDDFTIPSFKLRYFNPKTKEIKTVSTEPVDIKVSGAKKEKNIEVVKSTQNENKEVESNYKKEIKKTTDIAIKWIVITFIFAFLLGFIVAVFMMRKAGYQLGLHKGKKRFNPKDKKALFIKLLPYKDDKDVKSILDELEKELYKNENGDIDKKILKNVLKRYNIR